MRADWANLKPPSGVDMCLSYDRRLDVHDSDSALGRSTELPSVLQQRLTCKLDAEVLVCARPSTVPQALNCRSTLKGLNRPGPAVSLRTAWADCSSQSPGPAPEIQSPTKQRLGWL